MYILLFTISPFCLFPHSDSTCGTNGVKKSSDETPGAQSLFLNNTEHSTALAKSLVRGGLLVFHTCQSVRSVQCKPIIEDKHTKETFLNLEYNISTVIPAPQFTCITCSPHLSVCGCGGCHKCNFRCKHCNMLPYDTRKMHYLAWQHSYRFKNVKKAKRKMPQVDKLSRKYLSKIIQWF